MKLVYALAALTLALFIAMATFSSPLQPSIPALQFTFTETAFKNIISLWPAGGMDIFRGHFLIDFPFLLSYGVLGYVITTHTSLFSDVSTSIKTAFAHCLPCAAIADVMENLLHLYLVSAADPIPSFFYFAAGSMATVKWLLAALFGLAAIAALAVRAWRRFSL